jgi:hypothetical protein
LSLVSCPYTSLLYNVVRNIAYAGPVGKKPRGHWDDEVEDMQIIPDLEDQGEEDITRVVSNYVRHAAS